MYEIPSERCHKNMNATHQHMHDTRFTTETAVKQANAKEIC